MKRLILLLALPLALFAQVEVDTIIDLGHYLFNGHYIPEFNKLYVMAPYRLIALECSTWQVTAEYPHEALYGGARFAWNPLRQKLYVSFWNVNTRDSMLVVYPDADTARWVSPALYAPTYVASRDLLYGNVPKPGHNNLLALDCKTDSVVKTIPPPIPGFENGFRVSWDSVGDRVYSSVVAWGAPGRLAVYDVASDSMLALIELNCASPLKLTFHDRLRKAYFVSDGIFAPLRAGVIDTDSLSLIKFLFQAHGYGYCNEGRGPVALNTLMDKVYFGGNSANRPLPTNCTLHVVNRKDSIIRRIGYIGRGAHGYAVWIPWSNRVYFDVHDVAHMAVLDCETDSLIIPELVLPGQHRPPLDILLDPVRERIFAIGADTTAIHVLRDVPAGVAEGRGPGPRPAAPLRIAPNPARNRVRLAGTESAGLYAPDGRRVAALTPGDNDVSRLVPGLYFVRKGPGAGRGASDVIKVVIAR